MKVVDYKGYEEAKRIFLECHDFDYKVDTSPMDELGTYHKKYICEDGAIFYEVMMPVWEKVTAEVHKCTVSVDVKFFRTEFWSTDDAESSYYYEKF